MQALVFLKNSGNGRDRGPLGWSLSEVRVRLIPISGIGSPRGLASGGLFCSKALGPKIYAPGACLP